ncbi:MAG: NAD(P)/FAD-dependent oxidoreductase [Oceanicaulis sp.]
MASNIVRNAALRIAVLGAGAAGLAAAWRLARDGHSVTVCDRGEAERSALWASGGMLAGGFEAGAELETDHPLAAAFADLARRGADLWPDWTARLEAETGMALGYERRGSLLPAFTAEESERASAVMERARALGFDATRLDAETVAESEPGLAATLGGIEFSGDGQLDNRALRDALLDALRAAGAAIETGEARLETEAGHVQTVVIDGKRRIKADLVVLASGAFNVDGAPAVAAAEPVKGQMVAFAAGRPLAPNRVVRGFSIYLAAKPGQRLVAGATSEPGKGGLETDDAAIEVLMAAARAAVPGLAAVPVSERWAGLRPRAADSMPVIGEAGPGLLIATGGYRNGVLLAPALAEAVAAYAATGRIEGAAAPFTPSRPGLAGAPQV